MRLPLRSLTFIEHDGAVDGADGEQPEDQQRQDAHPDAVVPVSRSARIIEPNDDRKGAEKSRKNSFPRGGKGSELLVSFVAISFFLFLRSQDSPPPFSRDEYLSSIHPAMSPSSPVPSLRDTRTRYTTTVHDARGCRSRVRRLERGCDAPATLYVAHDDVCALSARRENIPYARVVRRRRMN